MDGITIAEAVPVEVSKPKSNRKRRKSAKKKSNRRATRAKALPSPVEPRQPESAQPETSGGLFGFLKSNPQNQPAENRPADSSGGSSNGSTANYEELSAEAERLLAAVPDTIGETHEGGTDGAKVPPGASDVGVGALLGPEVVTADILAGILKASFGWIADKRKRDVYRLNDERAAALAAPWCPVLNQWWTRFAPAFLAQWGAENPGLMAAILTTAVIVGPMVGADMKETAKERARRPMVQEGTSHHNPGGAAAARPAQPATAGGMFHNMGEAS